MKIFLAFAFMISFFSFSQIVDVRVDIPFDDPNDLNHLYIDTVTNSNNVWQIGKPNKLNFNGGYASDKTIVTDTLNPYPINDTSSFIIWVEHGDIAYNGNNAAILGNYKVNSDNLNDFGKIEFSPDKGLTWILISEDTLEYMDGAEIKNWPYYVSNCNLTGTNFNWQEFYINLQGIQTVFNLNIGDTLLYKFTFISDGIFDNLDGLEFDNIRLWDVWNLGVVENSEVNFNVFPNPVENYLTLTFADAQMLPQEVLIFDITGNIVSLNPIENSGQNSIDCTALTCGIYFFKLNSSDGVTLESGRFVKW